MTTFNGDNTASFGNNFLAIEIINPTTYPVVRAEFRVGCIVKTFTNPQNPIIVNFTEEESAKFEPVNIGYLAVWDSLGRKQTCPEYVKFDSKGRRV